MTAFNPPSFAVGLLVGIALCLFVRWSASVLSKAITGRSKHPKEFTHE